VSRTHRDRHLPASAHCCWHCILTDACKVLDEKNLTLYCFNRNKTILLYTDPFGATLGMEFRIRAPALTCHVDFFFSSGFSHPKLHKCQLMCSINNVCLQGDDNHGRSYSPDSKPAYCMNTQYHTHMFMDFHCQGVHETNSMGPWWCSHHQADILQHTIKSRLHL